MQSFTPQVSLRTSPQAGVAIRSLLQCKALRRLWRQGMRIPTPVCALARNDTLFDRLEVL